MKSKLLLVTGVIFGGIALAATASAARAQDSCADRVRQDQRELDRAVDRYGYDSSQAQHERAELRRDAANCGYDVDRDNRNGAAYGDRGYYGQRNSSAFDNGYRDGVAMGQRDAQKGKAYGPGKNDQYEDADRGYNKSYGDKKAYQNEYREGFGRGYSEGYGQNRNGSWR
jgi:hypothetical protein